MNFTKIYIVMSIIVMLGLPLMAEAISWSAWERKNAVAKKGDFLVIKQPGEGFCYLKQSYDDELDKLELSMKADNKPFLLVPFFQGLDGDVSYRIDDGPIRIIPAHAVANPLLLPTDVVPSLKKGNILIVRVKPVGSSTIEQHFSLRGFTAAAALLIDPQCKH